MSALSKTNDTALNCKAEITTVTTNTVGYDASFIPEQKKHGIGHKMLFYIPNRVLDLVDIFRLRAKVGSGISGSLQLTSVASFYAGTQNTVYAGLPGPRCAQQKTRPWGREKQKGIILFGVDATDDSLFAPEHSPSEIGLGLHILVVGIDAGIDPVEIGDFLAGIIGRDPKGDDK